jgi:putative ubiquitin-RnfH superfamily antitoxin RatB of RatAB toxin-antitoxin module
MPAAAEIRVEVVYALPGQQPILQVSLPEGATVEEAIRRSGVLEAFPGIDLGVNKVGIFSKLVKLDEKLRDRDRVEIYRPLIADPKEVRRKRAEEGKVTRKGGGEAKPADGAAESAGAG